MSKLQRKVQFARSRGIFIHKTDNIVRRNKSEMERASKLTTLSKFPKITVVRNLTGSGSYTINVTTLLMNPLGGLTYREAVNMAYEIAINPNKAFKGVTTWQE